MHAVRLPSTVTSAVSMSGCTTNEEFKRDAGREPLSMTPGESEGVQPTGSMPRGKAVELPNSSGSVRDTLEMFWVMRIYSLMEPRLRTILTCIKAPQSHRLQHPLPSYCHEERKTARGVDA